MSDASGKREETLISVERNIWFRFRYWSDKHIVNWNGARINARQFHLLHILATASTSICIVYPCVGLRATCVDENVREFVYKEILFHVIEYISSVFLLTHTLSHCVRPFSKDFSSHCCLPRACEYVAMHYIHMKQSLLCSKYPKRKITNRWNIQFKQYTRHAPIYIVLRVLEHSRWRWANFALILKCYETNRLFDLINFSDFLWMKWIHSKQVERDGVRFDEFFMSRSFLV